MRVKLPVDPVTLEEAAAILGCTPSSVRRRVAEGRLSRRRKRYKHQALSRADVEALAAEVYPWRRHLGDPESYWLTSGDAAAVLGVNRQRVQQMSEADRVPFLLHHDEIKLYRRHQMEVLAHNRGAERGLLRQTVETRSAGLGVGSVCPALTSIGEPQ